MSGDVSQESHRHSRVLPDVLPGPDDPPLRVLFCGINPGLTSAATGRHFARPGNRFWPALHGAGFTPRRLRPDEQHLLPALGVGITNIVPRATARADELSQAELVAGGAALRDLVGDLRPSALGVVGITAYRVAFAAPRATVGPQPAWGATLVWALPNPSGLNAHWSLPAMVAEFTRFRQAAAAARVRHSGCPIPPWWTPPTPS
ncbi:MAG: G/U mismatch-specific DNA glycosylase [Pseudonocardiaceae bacterium]